MSVMKSLRRLLPARKAWRLFTKTLQTKLHKLNRSKAIKKHKKKNHPHHHLAATAPNRSKPNLWSSLPFRSRSKQKTKTSQHVNSLRYKPHHRFQKKTAPVYVDHLFIEPVLALNQPSDRTRAAGTAKGDVRNSPVAGTSKGDGKSSTADDMWESLVLASPQMYGINERAEEFISRFREEIQGQERLYGTQL